MSKLNIPDEGTLVTKEEMITYMDNKFAELAKLIAGGVTPTPDPEPELPGKCKEGPLILSSKKISDRIVQVEWHGKDVTEIEATFKNSKGENILNYVTDSVTGNKLSGNGTFQPINAWPNLMLSSNIVQGERYEIHFKATKCTGESFAFFFDGVAPLPVPCKEARINSIDTQMNNIRIQISVDSLSELITSGGNNYPFVIKMFNSSGGALGNSNVPNVTSTSINTTGTTFFIYVPIVEDNYTINDITIKVYSGTDTNCCVATFVGYDLVNTVSEENDDPLEITLNYTV